MPAEKTETTQKEVLEEVPKEVPEEVPPRCRICHAPVDNRYYDVAAVVINVWAFVVDFATGVDFLSWDGWFAQINTLFCLSIMTIEWVVDSVARPHYCWGFCFWLETLGLITMALEAKLLQEFLARHFGEEEEDKAAVNIFLAYRAWKRLQRIFQRNKEVEASERITSSELSKTELEETNGTRKKRKQIVVATVIVCSAVFIDAFMEELPHLW